MTEASDVPTLEWFCSGYFDDPACDYTMTTTYTGGDFIGGHQCPKDGKVMYAGRVPEMIATTDARAGKDSL